MHYEVTEEQRNACAQDGALALKTVVSAEWREVLKAGRVDLAGSSVSQSGWPV